MLLNWARAEGPTRPVISTEPGGLSPQECSCSHINHACYDKPGAGPVHMIGEYLQTHFHLPSPIVMTSGVGKFKLKCWKLTRSYCIIMSNNLCSDISVLAVFKQICFTKCRIMKTWTGSIIIQITTQRSPSSSRGGRNQPSRFENIDLLPNMSQNYLSNLPWGY